VIPIVAMMDMLMNLGQHSFRAVVNIPVSVENVNNVQVVQIAKGNPLFTNKG
jgi:hypothetical protein